jgi:hypothetical protein
MISACGTQGTIATFRLAGPPMRDAVCRILDMNFGGRRKAEVRLSPRGGGSEDSVRAGSRWGPRARTGGRCERGGTNGSGATDPPRDRR